MRASLHTSRALRCCQNRHVAGYRAWLRFLRSLFCNHVFRWSRTNRNAILITGSLFNTRLGAANASSCISSRRIAGDSTQDVLQLEFRYPAGISHLCRQVKLIKFNSSQMRKPADSVLSAAILADHEEFYSQLVISMPKFCLKVFSDDCMDFHQPEKSEFNGQNPIILHNVSNSGHWRHR